MSDEAHTPRDARTTWSSQFQFEPSGGGLGIVIAASGTSARAALVGDGLVVRVSNDGTAAASVAFGNSSIVATTAYLRIQPGTVECFTLRVEDAITHAAAITASGTTSIQITLGNGG